jgi:hypothetical protein
MIYLVTKQQRFFKSDAYQVIDKEQALKLILEHDWIEYDSETEGLDPHTKALLCNKSFVMHSIWVRERPNSSRYYNSGC